MPFEKRIVGWLLLIMVAANIAEAIDGDIDFDGDVDFDDFLILVQNFGKHGPPSPARPDTIKELLTKSSMLAE